MVVNASSKMRRKHRRVREHKIDHLEIVPGSAPAYHWSCSRSKNVVYSWGISNETHARVAAHEWVRRRKPVRLMASLYHEYTCFARVR